MWHFWKNPFHILQCCSIKMSYHPHEGLLGIANGVTVIIFARRAVVYAHVSIITATKIATVQTLNKRNTSFLPYSLYCYQCESDSNAAARYIYPAYIYTHRRQ